MSFRNKFAVVLASVVLLALTAARAGAADPRVAIWDPVHGGTNNRFQLDLAGLNQITGWLKQAHFSADRLTAEQMADPAIFSAKHYDAALFIGNAFPRADLAALKQFADDGGVLIDLDADVPFLICLAPRPDGLWDLSPTEPRFAWQTSDILKMLGLQDEYQKATLQDQGTSHTATPLFRRYFPQAPDLHGRLPSRWIVPISASKGTPGEIYPLIRSQRSDKSDVPPQMYVVRSGTHCAIISVSDLYTSDRSTSAWPYGPQTVVAIAQLARDLHSHALQLQPDMAVQIREKKPLPPQPMDWLATGSVDPEHAQPLVRWGRFDGSAMEFGPPLAAGKTIELPIGCPSADFPEALEPGASMKLAIPALHDGPVYLRVRGAFAATGAALKATVGSETVLNESFVYIDTSGPSNFNHNLVGVPTQFTRIVFIPPGTAGPSTLILSNPGTKAIYFDAVQIERPAEPAPAHWIGLGAGYGNNYPESVSKTWSSIRMSLRTNLIGPPGQPDRFAKVDALFDAVAAKNARIQPILEGTPPWCAISSDRLEEAEKAKRPQTVPPDPQKYAQLVADVVKRYGSRVSSFEIWNEPDINQFYRGTPEEYATLFKTVVPVIRKLDPTAMVWFSMSGFHPDFLQKLIDAGVPQMADLIAFHPYAGKSPGWDVPYEQVEGYLMAHGIDREVYCNESGFPWKSVEWFKPPPDFTPQTQRDLLNVAMARLLACGLPKLSVFNAGGDDQPYGLFDATGAARPAYAAFADYLQLGQPTARRLDISITDPTGAPLQGVYAAASGYADGSVAIVINPAECELLQSADAHPPPVRICLPTTKPLAPQATMSAGSAEKTLAVQSHNSPECNWAELTVPMDERCVIDLRAQ